MPHNEIVLKKAILDIDTNKATSLFQHNLLQAKTPKPELHFTKFDFVISGILFFASNIKYSGNIKSEFKAPL